MSTAGFLADCARPAPLTMARPVKIAAYSKHFQWTNWDEMAAISKDVGFDGIDLTVRQGGHVLPERVEDDLPKAAEVIRKARLDLPMITTDIVDAQSPHAERTLKTARRLGIRNYRWVGFRYDGARSIPDRLNETKPRIRDLAELNKTYDVCAMYHTHSGLERIGGPIWDLWYILKDFDSRYVGVNYDIGHATVEGGYGGWVHSTRLAAPMIRGVAVKDFKWGMGGKGTWQPQWCKPGDGMVAFARFFAMLKAASFSGPLQLHCEYPELGGADAGSTRMSISRKMFTTILRRDLTYVRNRLKEAELL